MKQCLLLLLAFASTALFAGDKLTMNEAQLTHYVAAQEALAADDEAAARKALEQLAKASEGKLAELAAIAHKAPSMATVRTAFKPLSAAIMDMDLPAGHVLAYCPMAENNSGGHWVQKKGQLMNPYFGASMLHCGAVKRSGDDD